MTFSDLMQSSVDLLVHGLWRDAGAWTVLAWTLVTTHLTILGVTIYLHRAQAHRALDLHPAVSHFLRFWLWIGTGMRTKEFVAVHRKHHAKCETEEDPHSPQTRGLKALLLTGVELYRTEAARPETLAKYGLGTPDDWVERHVYKHHLVGIALMMALDVALFGVIGLTVWAVQMAWIPFWATGVINGVGHYWGYRNFEAADASTNVSPWGILVGGEELHNNHHTYPTSAKFSVKPYEFDIGWMYISALQRVGLATVRKTPPKLAMAPAPRAADARTLEALIANRYEVMAGYAKALRGAVRQARAEAGGGDGAPQRELKLARRWLHRDDDRLPAAVKPQLDALLDRSPQLSTLVTMREQLRQLWTRTNVSAEQLVADLQAWCRQAEASGIDALAQFSRRLRMAA